MPVALRLLYRALDDRCDFGNRVELGADRLFVELELVAQAYHAVAVLGLEIVGAHAPHRLGEFVEIPALADVGLLDVEIDVGADGLRLPSIASSIRLMMCTRLTDDAWVAIGPGRSWAWLWHAHFAGLILVRGPSGDRHCFLESRRCGAGFHARWLAR